MADGLPTDRNSTASAIRRLPMVHRALFEWHRTNGLRAPWRESGDPYEVLVAAVMAQQTQMSRVIPSYQRFLAAFPTAEALATASRGDVIRAWRGMGYNLRAVRLHRAARTIAAAGWPRDAATLATIDGIGPFTAAIVASFAFGEPAACVDTNVRRVLGRLAGDETINGRRLQALADATLARSQPARWNQAVMDYGARVCTPRPKCGECVVSRWCGWLRARPAHDRTRLRVAEQRSRYSVSAPRAKPGARDETPFEQSPRYFRGRIIDVLCGLPSGRTIAIGRLRERIANGSAPAENHVRDWLSALEREGLVEVRGERVALPD